ncbi:efflux RND transporter permease subunit, partial [Acinetobacter baumannii]
MENKAVVLTFAAALIVVCGVVATRLGSEFVPSLNEGDIAIQALRIPGTSLTQSIEMQKSIEKTLVKKFPEVERVFARSGTA